MGARIGCRTSCQRERLLSQDTCLATHPSASRDHAVTIPAVSCLPVCSLTTALAIKDGRDCPPLSLRRCLWGKGLEVGHQGRVERLKWGPKGISLPHNAGTFVVRLL